MRKPSSYRTGEHSLTQTEQEKLLAAIDNYKDDVLIRLSLSLGLRRNDIVRLQWTNINIEEHSVSYLEAKKGDSIHTAYISDNIAQLLNKWRGINKSRWVFPGSKDSHVSDRTAYNVLQEACDRAGIPRRPFHALRATCIKNCQRAGWPPEVTAEHVNDSLRTIQEHYTVPSSGERRAAALEMPII